MKLNPNIAELKEKTAFRLKGIREKLHLPELSMNNTVTKIFAGMGASIILGAVVTASVYVGVTVSKGSSAIDKEIKEAWLTNLKMDNKLKELSVVTAYGEASAEEGSQEPLSNGTLSQEETPGAQKIMKKMPKTAGTKKTMVDPLLTEVTESVTKEDLEQRYKEISVRSVGKNIKVVDLWTDKKRENAYSVRILFAFNKLYYSGNMGTFVFGRTISNVYKFFAGSQVNEAYWAEKCEAASVPVVCEDIDLNKIRENLTAELSQNGELTEKIKNDVDETLNKICENIEGIIDFLIECLKKYDIYDVKATADSIVRQSEDYNKNYIYACEVIQWVSNNLKDWETDEESEQSEKGKAL